MAARSRGLAALLLAAALACACLAPGGHAQHHHRQDSDRGSGASDLAAWVVQFANYPPPLQAAILAMAGTVLKDQLDLKCNPFDGVKACQPLPSNTPYAVQCGKMAQTKVDCVLDGEVAANQRESIADDLDEFLGRSGSGAQRAGRAACPQCYERLQALWCTLAVPPCGVFQAQLQNGLLPVFSRVVRDYTSHASATHADAVAKSLPDLLRKAQAGLPCREMCEAAVATCGCSRGQETLGSLITYITGNTQLAGRTPMLTMHGRMLFKQVWDMPLCELLPTGSGQAASQLMGRCDASPAATCADTKAWCGDAGGAAAADTPKHVQALLLMQILRVTTGWVANDQGVLWSGHDSMHSAVTDVPADVWERAAADAAASDAAPGDGAGRAAGSSRLSGGQVAGITVLSVFGAAAMAAGAVMGVARWRDAQQHAPYSQLSADEQREFVQLVEERESLLGEPAGHAPRTAADV